MADTKIAAPNQQNYQIVGAPYYEPEQLLDMMGITHADKVTALSWVGASGEDNGWFREEFNRPGRQTLLQKEIGEMLSAGYFTMRARGWKCLKDPKYGMRAPTAQEIARVREYGDEIHHGLRDYTVHQNGGNWMTYH